MQTLTTSTLPAEAVRLRPSFDPQRLQAELTDVTGRTWDKQRIYGSAGTGAQADLDWRVLPLRSIGGDPARTDPGGPGDENFANTRWLDQLPYLQQILSAVPAPLNAARLMALGSGAACAEHCDPKYSARRGFARLHIPIVTNPGAVLTLDGVEHRWQPGDFWFGEFARPHKVRNDGPDTRIHLVIDALITVALVDLFPDDWHEILLHGDVLFNQFPAPDGPPPSRSVVFEAPGTFANFNNDDVLNRDTPLVPMRLGGSDQPHLEVDERRYALVHLGDGEFRFAGWSEQRTIQLLPNAVVLRTRDGRTTRELTIPTA